MPNEYFRHTSTAIKTYLNTGFKQIMIIIIMTFLVENMPLILRYLL